jgi:plasmid stabilization system protein ParE
VARRFEEELARISQAILARPEVYPKHRKGTRRALLQRFPYGVIYRVVGDEIQILAIAHTRQRPGYWIERL